MDLAKLKLAIIGTGGIARGAHIQPWLQHPEVELVALCDIKIEKAEAFARDFCSGALTFADYRDLLKLEEVDIVDICTPNLFHSEIAVAALRAGKQVLCEKPDAINPLEAEKMLLAAKETGNLLMTIRNNRFSTTSRFLKRYIEAGYMGEIYHGRCGWIRRRGIPGKGGWFTTKSLSGGGPLIDLGVHMIDLAMWFMGNPTPVAVVGSTYCKFADSTLSDSVHSKFGEKQAEGTFDVEDLAGGFIKFANGASLAIEFSWASNVESEGRFCELRGTKSGASIHRDELKLYTEIEGALCDIVPRIPRGGGHGDQIKHFVDCVLKRAEPIVTPIQGLNMIKILDAMYRSAETGYEVRL